MGSADGGKEESLIDLPQVHIARTRLSAGDLAGARAALDGFDPKDLSESQRFAVRRAQLLLDAAAKKPGSAYRDLTPW
jgi:hypothetical protein